jgi:hypothetical protein
VEPSRNLSVVGLILLANFGSACGPASESDLGDVARHEVEAPASGLTRYLVDGTDRTRAEAQRVAWDEVRHLTVNQGACSGATSRFKEIIIVTSAGVAGGLTELRSVRWADARRLVEGGARLELDGHPATVAEVDALGDTAVRLLTARTGQYAACLGGDAARAGVVEVFSGREVKRLVDSTIAATRAAARTTTSQEDVGVRVP